MTRAPWSLMTPFGPCSSDDRRPRSPRASSTDEESPPLSARVPQGDRPFINPDGDDITSIRYINSPRQQGRGSGRSGEGGGAGGSRRGAGRAWGRSPPPRELLRGALDHRELLFHALGRGAAEALLHTTAFSSGLAPGPRRRRTRGAAFASSTESDAGGRCWCVQYAIRPGGLVGVAEGDALLAYEHLGEVRRLRRAVGRLAARQRVGSKRDVRKAGEPSGSRRGRAGRRDNRVAVVLQIPGITGGEPSRG